MLFTSAFPLLATTLLVSTTYAAPTRTHCRCTIVADAPPSAIFTPSAAHWTPAESSPSAVAADLCANLGPELENFQHTKTDLYESYLSRTEGASGNNAQQRPLTTKVFVNFAARNELAKRNSEKEPRPTTRPQQHIVCRSEPDPFSEYQGSFVTLWALQIIVIIAILACLAEGLHLSLQWYGTPEVASYTSWMRLPGRETLVLAIPTPSTQESEKTARTYEAMPILIVQTPNGDRVCISYEEDDDDEMNRPVM
ncbi:hypothetical protein CC86DRAFT_121490 [Ophiobolus disseminans]|uniref:Uncharacterized protein n=1 Tax=Ophiobolus disseminans TaxID=1469910 RepID=A0A6A6ZFU3_9PLEO|nr:hypothetical protein CC86DRAFT_121490 [Ophiobolus disseminans]